MTKPSAPRRRAQTEFRVTPPLIQRIKAPGFPGLDLLDDLPDDAALLFWQAFSDTELWARSDSRGDLFQTSAEREEARQRAIAGLDNGLYGEAKPHLLTLLGVVAGEENAEHVADACFQLSAWFEGRGQIRCSVVFALAAYFTFPGRASLAVRVARLVRVLAEYPRGISWFDYAIYLARRSNDWSAYTAALAGLGNLYFYVGNLPRARQFHRRCLRASRRNHLPEMVGAAYHNLFVLEMDAGNVELAENLAAKALAAYPADSTCLVRLARDLSRRWNFLGCFERALPLALEELNHFTVPADRALVWADVARAAGGAGEEAIFEDAWAETWVLVQRGVTEPHAADVLIDLAHGAASLGDARRAARAAGKALEIARQRKEGRTILEAEAILDSLRVKHNVPPEPRARQSPEEVPALATEVLEALQHLRAAA